MNQENYRILEVDASATDEEVKASYERLKEKYNEEKWQEGEAGNEAARMLDKLDAAYREVMDERKENSKTTSGEDAYTEVTNAIKAGNIPLAQELWDGFNERNAEWHYLQSVVFYKKNWLVDSKKQLEIAIQMDGANTKYRDAFEKLNRQTDYASQTGGAPNINPNPAPQNEMGGGNWCSTCASMCYTYMCVNCLFNLCCGCR